MRMSVPMRNWSESSLVLTKNYEFTQPKLELIQCQGFNMNCLSTHDIISTYSSLMLSWTLGVLGSR